MIFAYIAGILALMAGSALFSATAEEGNRRAKTAVKLLDHFDDTLSAILIGNNLCNIAADSLTTLLAMMLLGARYNGFASALITAGMTLFIIFFCESAPKIAAKKNANRASMEFGGFLRMLTVVLLPLIVLVRWIIRLITLPLKGGDQEDSPEEAAAELQSIIETVEDEGVIDEDRSELLLSALDFSQIPVMDVMTARVDVEALDVDEDWRELLLAGEAPFSRIPVFEGSIDNIIGILYLNRFFKALLNDPETDLRSQLMEPLFVYKTVKLMEVLSQFRLHKQHMAIVTDEYGGTLGVVTLEDVLEHLVGEIWDETDDIEPDVVERSDGAFEVDGDLPIGDFAELLDMKERDFGADSATAGGWTIEKFGAFPKAGDTVEDMGVRVKVLSMDEDGRRVEKLLAEKIEDET